MFYQDYVQAPLSRGVSLLCLEEFSSPIRFQVWKKGLGTGERWINLKNEMSEAPQKVKNDVTFPYLLDEPIA